MKMTLRNQRHTIPRKIQKENLVDLKTLMRTTHLYLRVPLSQVGVAQWGVCVLYFDPVIMMLQRRKRAMRRVGWTGMTWKRKQNGVGVIIASNHLVT